MDVSEKLRSNTLAEDVLIEDEVLMG